jgi:hypothetical protein
MTSRLPHVRESAGEPDVCIFCREEWVDLLTLYERDECSVRLRAALDAERAVVVAWLRAEAYLTLYEATPSDVADAIERGEHRAEETE